MQHIVIDFFSKIVQADVTVLESLDAFHGTLYFEGNTKSLVFSLPALHLFLAEEVKLDYHEFRKMIYQSTINSQLANLGVKIEIHQANNTVDDNLYKLDRL